MSPNNLEDNQSSYVKPDYPLSEITGRIIAAAKHIVQSLSYLRASGYEIGLLLNFGSKTLGIKRLINTPKRGNTDIED